jgi:hypothetical protein
MRLCACADRRHSNRPQRADDHLRCAGATMLGRPIRSGFGVALATAALLRQQRYRNRDLPRGTSVPLN